MCRDIGWSSLVRLRPNKKDIKLNLAKAALNMVKAVVCVELEEEDVQLLHLVEETHLDAEDPWVLARPMQPSDAEDVFIIRAERQHLQMAEVVGGVVGSHSADQVHVDMLALAEFVGPK